MENVLLVVHLLLAIALVCVILMQRTAQDGGGLMGGSSTMGGLFTARGSANLLTRTTAILATLFICTSLVLGIMASHQHRQSLSAEDLGVPAQSAPQKDEKPAASDKKADDAKPEEQKGPQGQNAEKPTASKPGAPQVPVSK